MGKVATTEMKRKMKKKGRPSLLDLQKRSLNQQSPQTLISASPNFTTTPIRRSTRRNPQPNALSSAPQLIDGDCEDDDDEDERKEKKVKLVVRLPQLNQHFNPKPPSLANSPSYDSNGDDDSNEASLKKRKINDVCDRSDGVVADQGEKASKATDTLHGSSLESGPTTPLPDKKLLVFILDRLQKKDTYGVFSEPVDPNELPDYFEIIEHPMDFGTVRKKLHEGLYSNLEALEADILLICSNAMQYNASDTVYFRQARSIQELAKRDFDNLRQEGEDGEPQPKVVRRGRPPSKNLKKPPGRAPVECVGLEFSSEATFAAGEEDVVGSNSYNLRRGPMPSRYRSSDAPVTSNRSRNGENYTEWLSDWNDEFPASILKADMKYGKKQFSLDENRRDTYKQFHPSASRHELSAQTNSLGDMKQLVAVGLHLEHGYARSLARFAANLGPVVWKIASKKIESVLAPGLKFGPGWVGENDASAQLPSISSENQRPSNKLACDGYPSRPGTPLAFAMNSIVAQKDSLPCKEERVETAGRIISQNDLAGPKSGFSGTRPIPSIQAQQKSMLHPEKNGFNGMLGYDLPSQMGMGKLAVPMQLRTSLPVQTVGTVYKDGNPSSCPVPRNSINLEGPISDNSRKLHGGNLSASDTGLNSRTPPEGGLSRKPSWQVVSPHHREYPLSVPPDLNIQFQSPNSPSSSLQIGSPQQPDLALQL